MCAWYMDYTPPRLTLHTAPRTPHHAARLVRAKSVWWVKIRRVHPGHFRGLGVYAHITMASNRLIPPPPPLPPTHALKTKNIVPKRRIDKTTPFRVTLTARQGCLIFSIIRRLHAFEAVWQRLKGLGFDKEKAEYRSTGAWSTHCSSLWNPFRDRGRWSATASWIMTMTVDNVISTTRYNNFVPLENFGSLKHSHYDVHV